MSAPQKPVLSAKDVRCDITGHTIASGINLSFGTEPMTAIVGVNGAGKSTLLCMFGGIAKPAAGEVGISSKSMNSINSKHCARDLAFMAQGEVPLTETRVRDFISPDRLPYQRFLGSNTVEDNPHVDRALALISLGTAA